MFGQRKFFPSVGNQSRQRLQTTLFELKHEVRRQTKKLARRERRTERSRSSRFEDDARKTLHAVLNSPEIKEFPELEFRLKRLAEIYSSRSQNPDNFGRAPLETDSQKAIWDDLAALVSNVRENTNTTSETNKILLEIAKLIEDHAKQEEFNLKRSVLLWTLKTLGIIFLLVLSAVVSFYVFEYLGSLRVAIEQEKRLEQEHQNTGNPPGTSGNKGKNVSAVPPTKPISEHIGDKFKNRSPAKSKP